MGGTDQQDVLLARVADEVQLTCVSVGYRLAPEYAAPAALDDCSDVASWMVENGREKFGCDLAFLGGEVCVKLNAVRSRIVLTPMCMGSLLAALSRLKSSSTYEKNSSSFNSKVLFSTMAGTTSPYFRPGVSPRT